MRRLLWDPRFSGKLAGADGEVYRTGDVASVDAEGIFSPSSAAADDALSRPTTASARSSWRVS